VTPQQIKGAQRQGLMAAGGAGLQASGFSRMPVSTGQVLGQMVGAGMPAYQNALGRAAQGTGMRQSFDANALTMDRQRQKIAAGTVSASTARLGAVARGKIKMYVDPKTRETGFQAAIKNPTMFDTIMQGYPEMAGRLMEQQLRDPFIHNVGQGDTAIGPDGKPVFTNPAAPVKPSSFMEKVQMMQKAFPNASQGEIMSRVGAMGSTNLTVNTNNTQSKIWGNADPGFFWAKGPGGEHVMEGMGVNDANGDEIMGPKQLPLGGGTVATERAEAAAKAVTVYEAAVRQAQIVSTDIDRIIEGIEANPNLTTGWAGLIAAIPGTPAHAVQQTLKTIEANMAFKALADMKAASPSGGALGAINTEEMNLLKAQWGALKQTQKPEDLIYNLRRIQVMQNDIIHGEGLWILAADGSITNDTSGKKPSEVNFPPISPNDVPPGKMVELPDGTAWLAIGGQWVRGR
jgi:hypothetical protein